MLAIISCIAASILVTLSGICEWPKGPLKGALTAAATPEKNMEVPENATALGGNRWENMGRYGHFMKDLGQIEDMGKIYGCENERGTSINGDIPWSKEKRHATTIWNHEKTP